MSPCYLLELQRCCSTWPQSLMALCSMPPALGPKPWASSASLLGLPGPCSFTWLRSELGSEASTRPCGQRCGIESSAPSQGIRCHRQVHRCFSIQFYSTDNACLQALMVKSTPEKWGLEGSREATPHQQGDGGKGPRNHCGSEQEWEDEGPAQPKSEH